MSEKRFRKNMSTFLRRGGAVVSNIEDRAGSGVPDTHAVRPVDRVLWLELKYNRAPPTSACDFTLRPAQARWLEAAWRVGASAWMLVCHRDGTVTPVPGCSARMVRERNLTSADLVSAFGLLDTLFVEGLWKQLYRRDKDSL